MFTRVHRNAGARRCPGSVVAQRLLRCVTTARNGSAAGLDERRLYGSPTRLAGFGQRVQGIGWQDPTLSGPK